MATQSQIEANRLNAEHSTGPRTESGKETSSCNHLTFGLYTRQDYVKPEERELYKEFCETMQSEIGPMGMLEDTLAAEIIGASWRLRRCSAAEGKLADFATTDPLLDDSTEKTRRSVERARASAHSHFHRAVNQLRKMQTEREIRVELLGEDKPGLADCRKVEAARSKRQRTEESAVRAEDDAFMERVMAFCEPPPEAVKLLEKELMAKYEAVPETGLASNCEGTEHVLNTPDGRQQIQPLDLASLTETGDDAQLNLPKAA